jgi:hypothetical protein
VNWLQTLHEKLVKHTKKTICHSAIKSVIRDFILLPLEHPTAVRELGHLGVKGSGDAGEKKKYKTQTKMMRTVYVVCLFNFQQFWYSSVNTGIQPTFLLELLV